MAETPPPGWYRDPSGPELRYWNGTSWTEHRAPTHSPVGGPAVGIPATTLKRSPDRTRGLKVLAVLILVAAGLWFFFGYNSAENKAQRACHDYVELRLKAPSTADFSDEFATDQGDDAWTVYGNVDSENGFGAKVRNSFTCEVSRDGGSFTVDDADFSEDDDD